MAKKILSTSICSSCEHQSAQWLGKCPKCRVWNSFVNKKEENVENDGKDKKKMIPSTEIKQLGHNRIQVHIDEFDRVMGGGMVLGSLTLLGGDPGIGKSTLLTSVLGTYALKNEQKVLYVSGEETCEQVGLRINRLGLASSFLYVDHETKWQSIEANMKSLKPKLVLIDSIQTIYSQDISGHPGATAQVKEVTLSLMNFAKQVKTSIIIIGHITKDGSLAGPKLLEHMVDTVLYFEADKNSDQRILRPVKNRFGATNEIGVFEMNEKGLSPVKNPLQQFIEQSNSGIIGTCLGKLRCSEREILCEIQTLILDNNSQCPKKAAQGFELNRMNILLAVIEKYLNIKLGSYDIYMNITGPSQKNEKQIDLPIVASIMSSYRKKSIKTGLVLNGELSLSGAIKGSSLAGLNHIVNLEAHLF